MPKPKQDELEIAGPGVAPIKIAEIDRKVTVYCAAREQHSFATEKLTEAKQALIESMHAHEKEIGKDDNGEIIYRCGDEVVIVKPGKDELKVKTAPGVPE